MQTIVLDSVIPSFLEGVDPGLFNSEVWGTRLELERGGKYLVKAASGRGKTTLCNILTGLRTDYRGTVSFDGEDIRGLSEKEWAGLRRRTFSSMFQGLILFDELNPIENIRIKPMSRDWSDAELREMLDRLGIGEKAGVKCRRLSFGQKQRVAFIRMLCQSADFLILDEPVSHLDSANAGIMSAMLSERIERDGAGVIVTSIGRDLPFSYDKEVEL